MIVLGIDTATESVSVAVVDGDDVLAASESRSDRRHAEDLTPMIDFVVRGSGVLLPEIDAIAVDVGPGLFTGMRVGIASAQALAHVLSVPLVGVDGLEALVAAAPDFSGDLVVPTIDARRRQVAWALHRVDADGRSGSTPRRVTRPVIGPLDDLIAALRERSQSCVFVGDFAQRHRDDIAESLGIVPWKYEFADTSAGGVDGFPHARHVALIAHRRLVAIDTAGEAVDFVGLDDVLSDASARGSDPTHLAPSVAALYLREADAEINWTTRAS
jgi:tRNA threonylcarbamoyladenosine biosynthesis protein TsaB